MSIYQRINGADWRNIWVVGDLHGCYTNLTGKLDELKFDPEQDLLISVGDLIDRGYENVECLELIMMPWFRAVRGNHEQMMIDGLSEYGNVNHWLMNGGGWFFNLDYDKEVLAKALVHKAAELPLVIELVTGDKKIVICHADYPAGTYEFGKDIDEEQVIWNRERIANSQDGNHHEITGADLFVFGHTPASQPLKYANQMYIDTGAVFCGNLTLVQVQGGVTMRKPTSRSCKICKTKFTATYDNVWWCCPEHGYEYSQLLLAKKKLAAERKRKNEAQQERRELKIRKKALQPISQYHKRAQTAFNAFIRQRDAGQPCISCGRNSGAKMNAGHFRTVGASPETRYDETNCHIQCEACNSYLSGNIGEYRPRLIAKIGQDAYDRLMGPHEAKKWTREELDALAAHYRAKLKELKQQESA